MKHYFLGTASEISREERILRRKLKGEKADYEKLTEYLTEYYSAKQTLVLRNGRSAIAAGLKYGIKEKGEVIINGFTCRAVVQGIKGAGFTPVYADISRENLNFTISDLEKVLTKNTRAVIIQNTLGNMVEIKEIEAFCKKNKLVLIEDLAHSYGLKYSDGREAGTVGEITVLSFGKEKMIDAGNGGAVVFRENVNDLPELKNIAPKDEEFRSRIYPTIGYISRGLSYIKLSGLFMRLMLKMKYVVKSAEGDVDLTSHLGYFQSKLALLKLVSGTGPAALTSKTGDTTWGTPAKNSPANFCGGNVVAGPVLTKTAQDMRLREFCLVSDREKCLEELKRAGYYFEGFWYDKPIAPERYYKKIGFPEEKCPNAVFVSEHIINLPTHYNKKELRRAREIVKKYLIKDENE